MNEWDEKLNIYDVNLLILFYRKRLFKSEVKPHKKKLFILFFRALGREKTLKIQLKCKRDFMRKAKKKYLESNQVQSSDGHKYKCQFPNHRYRVPNSLANIDKLVDQRCYSLLPAIQLCLFWGEKKKRKKNQIIRFVSVRWDVG